jgi:hypothetical protein
VPDNLTRLKKLEDFAPSVMKALWNFEKAAVAAATIPVKFMELIESRLLSLRNVRTASTFTAATHAKQVQPTPNWSRSR